MHRALTVFAYKTYAKLMIIILKFRVTDRLLQRQSLYDITNMT